ncbi:MAG: hypothetical protein V1845_01795 [bacterium]
MKKDFLKVVIIIIVVGIFWYAVGHRKGFQRGFETGFSEGRDRNAGTLLSAQAGKVYVAVVAGVDMTDEKNQDRKYYRLDKHASVGERYLVSQGGMSRIRTE